MILISTTKKITKLKIMHNNNRNEVAMLMFKLIIHRHM